MKRALIISISCLLFCRVTASPADKKFETVAQEFTEDYLRSHPENTTELGDHRYDGLLSDYSPAGVQAHIVALQSFLSQVKALDQTQLTGANVIDVQVLGLNIESELFELLELRLLSNDPLIYDQSLANGIYLLTAREFAAPSERLKSIAKRLAGIPSIIEQAEGNLQHPPRIYTETAISHVDGAISLIQSSLDPLLKDAPGMKDEITPLQSKAIDALKGYKKWLAETLLPRSDGSFRLGPELYRKKLRYELASDLSPEQILSRAQTELVAATEALYQTGLPLFKTSHPAADAKALADHRTVIKAVLNQLAESRPTDATIVGYADGVIKESTEFVKAHDLVTVPVRPIKMIVTPEFQRGRGIAYCSPPGALEPNGETFVAVEPTPPDWPEARRVSFYKEYNNYMVHDLIVHEAMPGHYLQFAHSNQFKAPTLIRALFWSSPFAEGWAVYSERVMAEAGFGGPPVRMEQLKMRLRVVINAILDQKLHITDMTDQQALDLMMNEGFQEEGEAVAKLKRAKLSSTQLSTYFVGTIEHDDLRAAAEKKWGQNFDLKKYHDTVLSFGTPPVKFVRKEMGL